MAQETQEDAVALLLEQHETVRNLLVAVERETGDARLEVFQPLVRLLAVHETAEEMVIYPAIRSPATKASASPTPGPRRRTSPRRS